MQDTYDDEWERRDFLIMDSMMPSFLEHLANDYSRETGGSCSYLVVCASHFGYYLGIIVYYHL